MKVNWFQVFSESLRLPEGGIYSYALLGRST